MAVIKSVETAQKLGLHPPVVITLSDPTKASWRMFERFFKHAAKSGDAEVSLISRHLYGAMEASGGTVEGQLLALWIAIEGLLNETTPNLSLVTEGLAHAVSRFKEYAMRWPGQPGWSKSRNENFKQRVVGAVSGIARARAADRLRYLQRKGYVEQKEVEIWTDVRNRTAHAALLDPQKFAEMVHAIQWITVLLHKIVFRAIQYRGRFTGYGSPDWPSKHFPISNPTSPA